MTVKTFHAGTAWSTKTKRDSMDTWTGKATESIPNRKKVFASGVVLVPLILVTWWKKIMWSAFGAFAVNTVSCSFRLLDRQSSMVIFGVNRLMS